MCILFDAFHIKIHIIWQKHGPSGLQTVPTSSPLYSFSPRLAFYPPPSFLPSCHLSSKFLVKSHTHVGRLYIHVVCYTYTNSFMRFIKKDIRSDPLHPLSPEAVLLNSLSWFWGIYLHSSIWPFCIVTFDFPVLRIDFWLWWMRI